MDESSTTPLISAKITCFRSLIIKCCSFLSPGPKPQEQELIDFPSSLPPDDDTDSPDTSYASLNTVKEEEVPVPILKFEEFIPSNPPKFIFDPTIAPIVNVNSPIAVTPSKKKKKKKKGLPIFHHLKEGLQVVGNGKFTVLAVVKCVQVNSPIAASYMDNARPDYVPTKYWNQRYNIFSRFDEGIQMDEESWYSVTHESIAEHIAQECSWAHRVMDGFGGAGGNVIQFARYCDEVVSVELDPQRIDYCRNNARIYGVEHKIKFVQGDFLEVGDKQGEVDVLFMSPPWGGPSYMTSKKYDIMTMMTPDIRNILEVCERVTRNVILYLPRNVDPLQITQLFQYMPSVERKVEFQLYYFGQKIKTIACIMGDMVTQDIDAICREMVAKMPIPRHMPTEPEECAKLVSEELHMHGFNAAVDLMMSKKKKGKKKKKFLRSSYITA